MINKIHLQQDGLGAHRCNDIQTLIEIRKHSQHVNEKLLWEQFHAEGEEGQLYFGVRRCKATPLVNGGQGG